ncbi:MAG: hypothetical protein HFJ29_08965 [Clostridia bacterium]|jgi:predicted RNA-binding Zn-ribbon protein involved in translation (DUF1610 family)|nr:hypothetical protein [Clostridia bacterium]
MERNNKNKKCPKCGGLLGERPALSRRDNKTDICSDCGFKEAMEDAEKIIQKYGRKD